jgi:hypothetical protein
MSSSLDEVVFDSMGNFLCLQIKAQILLSIQLACPFKEQFIP